MRACVVVFCLVALAVVTLASPRRVRQINPDDSESLNDLSEDTDRWRPTRPTRPSRPSRPTRPTRLTPASAPFQTTPPILNSQAGFDCCMRDCEYTPQYNPLCCIVMATGERKTYNNSGERGCAEHCGEASTFLNNGSCTLTSPPSQEEFDRCMRGCTYTPQYDPLCCLVVATGLNKTYKNNGERACAESCGEASTILFNGSCTP